MMNARLDADCSLTKSRMGKTQIGSTDMEEYPRKRGRPPQKLDRGKRFLVGGSQSRRQGVG
jgi:hypothetical protein